ncbi:hypothetical protein BDV95DRAFT_615680 [Massariosphaeria phaeospora]|uniref:Uncharacterized protein n=1 Tax=Massariosphaeria phaeospora TaxID=100035 RepID=A0A7C8MHN6_9PLEO|nr:hypothetical protein BDV95DRAFT_615680 [Massariosphaeria phaeospora]
MKKKRLQGVVPKQVQGNGEATDGANCIPLQQPEPLSRQVPKKSRERPRPTEEHKKTLEGIIAMPEDIQRKILPHLLVFANPIPYERHKIWAEKIQVPWLMCHKSLAPVVTDIWWRQNTWEIRPTKDLPDMVYLPPAGMRDRIRKLRFLFEYAQPAPLSSFVGPVAKMVAILGNLKSSGFIRVRSLELSFPDLPGSQSYSRADQRAWNSVGSYRSLLLDVFANDHERRLSESPSKAAIFCYSLYRIISERPRLVVPQLTITFPSDTTPHDVTFPTKMEDMMSTMKTMQECRKDRLNTVPSFWLLELAVRNAMMEDAPDKVDRIFKTLTSKYGTPAGGD